jgi:hypothetical protein
MSGGRTTEEPFPRRAAHTRIKRKGFVRTGPEGIYSDAIDFWTPWLFWLRRIVKLVCPVARGWWAMILAPDLRPRTAERNLGRQIQ